MSQSAQNITQCLLYACLSVSVRAIPGVWELEVFLLRCFSCCLSQTRLGNLEAEAASDPQTDPQWLSLQNSVKHSIAMHIQHHIRHT